MFAELLALRGQLRRIDAAVDQVEAEPGFQRFDAAAEGGLRRVPSLGGTGKIPGLRNHQKILKPTELHPKSLASPVRNRSEPMHGLTNANFASPLSSRAPAGRHGRSGVSVI